VGRTKEYVRIFASDKKGRALEHHYLNAKKWAAPAGKIEKGEAPARAAIRELVERTGYTAESVKSIGKKRDETGALFHEFEASGVSAVGKPQTEIRWKESNMNQFLLAGFKFEIEKIAFEPESVLAGLAIPSILRRVLAMGNVAKAKKIVGALEAKGLPTEGLPFTVRNPGIGAMFAPGTLGKRVAEVETSAREYADRRMGRAMSKEIAAALS
jgi:hypothetical protein